jgi:plasmid stability protein
MISKTRTNVADLLIRNIKPQLKRRLAERARKSGRSMSDEVKSLIEKGMHTSPQPPKRLGDFLYSLVEDRDRGHDLTFERNDLYSPPPNFE